MIAAIPKVTFLDHPLIGPFELNPSQTMTRRLKCSLNDLRTRLSTKILHYNLQTYKKKRMKEEKREGGC